MNEDKATRYHRRKRQLAAASLAWRGFLLAGLLSTGYTSTLRHGAAAAVSRIPVSAPLHPTLTVVIYVVLLSLVNEVGALPLAYCSGFALERRYGLSDERLDAWLRERVKSFGVGLIVAC